MQSSLSPKSPHIRSPQRSSSTVETQGGSQAASSSGMLHPAQLIKLGKRYRLVRRLGGGAFGEVYVAMDVVTEEYVAVKLEPVATIHQPHLYHEARLYQLLTRGLVTVGIPRIRYCGREGEYNVLVMDLLGPCLEDLYDYCHRKFCLKTVCMLGIQLIQRLEFLHAMGFIHRDLKPENFVMGIGRRAHHVYMIDMGLAKRYRDSKTGEHIPFIEGKALTGTARYVSINTHMGQQQARRDDMESLAFILIYFAAGGLPWQGIKCQNKLDKYAKIKSMKAQVSTEELCKEISSPQPFMEMLEYSRQLAFSEQPDYNYCRRLLEDLMTELQLDHDYKFQWLESAASCEEIHNQILEKKDEATDNTGGGSALGGDSSMVTNSSGMFTGSPKGHAPSVLRKSIVQAPAPQQVPLSSGGENGAASPDKKDEDGIFEAEFM